MAVKRTLLLLAGVLLTMTALTGCSMPKLSLNPQDMYALPTLSAKYTELNTQLNAILEGGAEYAAPTSGANIQTVQLVDLDGDSRKEAVAFFRNSNDEKPLKIYIFAAEGDSYVQTDLIEGSGTGIYSVAYLDLDGDGRKELLIGWKATADLQVLEVYALRSGGATALIRSDYVKYTAADLDLDQRQELVILRVNNEGESVADYYNWQSDGSLSSQSSARVSSTMAELSQQGKVTKGTLKGEIPALFVTGVTDLPGAVTDILAVRNGELYNIVLSSATGVSGEIDPYCGLYPTDINNDDRTEVPHPVLSEDGRLQRVDWCYYDSSGEPFAVMYTYHDMDDGWYLQLPESWVGQVYVSRSAGTDEASVTFYALGDDGQESVPILRISALTGNSREVKAARGDRFLLSRQMETIYTAELPDSDGVWPYAMTEDEIRTAFNLIVTEWSTGDY
jgi:hypothetical protein